MTRNLEVMSSNPIGCMVFLLLLSFPSFLHKWSVLNQVPQGGASLTVCCEGKYKIGCLAVLPWENRLNKLRLGFKNSKKSCKEKVPTEQSFTPGKKQLDWLMKNGKF